MFGAVVLVIIIAVFGILVETILWIPLKAIGKNPDDYFEIDATEGIG